MKRTLSVICALAALSVLLCSCSDRGGINSGNDNADEAVVSSAKNETLSEYAPFSSYISGINGKDGNYIAVFSVGEHPDEISVVLENNSYESFSYVITAPAGYRINFPETEKNASDTARIFRNDFDDDKIVPDIFQIAFSDDSGDSISRLYTINENRVCEIPVYDFRSKNRLYDDDDDDGYSSSYEQMDYLGKVQLIHTEPEKFIYEIEVDDRKSYDSVKISTLYFDRKKLCMYLDYEEISEQNTLYFGYAWWSMANAAAGYFIADSFLLNDSGKKKSRASEGYYLKVSDERFESTDDLREYLRRVFTDNMAESIFENAYQQYTDIDGELYCHPVSAELDSTLGTLNFTNFEMYENRVVYHSRQEKYDYDGRSAGYTDGGDFVLSLDVYGEWRVSQYRYPFV